jgi:tetratricopeptide (TPR) repeat protein
MRFDLTWVAAGSSKDRRSTARRLSALAVGLGILLIVELLLRATGYGGPGHRPDPFAGFSTSEPLFIQASAANGTPIMRTRPDRVGQFNLQEFTSSKAAGTTRIFCLGGSSTFGFPYDHRLSFCSAVERGLRRVHPENEFEVINCGGMSYGARRVLNIMRELTAYEPDGFVVYTGHNEYVERRFFAPFLDEPAWRRSLRGGLNRLRIYVAVRRVLAPLTERPGSQDQDDLFGVGSPARDDSHRQLRDAREDALVEEQFRFAVREMVALAARSGSEMFMLLPATNLRDWAPEGSTWDARLTTERVQLRDQGFAAATRLHQAGNDQEALTAIDEVLELDPLPAAAHFLRGQILLALDLPGAGESFREARDQDAVPIRITSSLSTVIRESWGEGTHDHLDAEQVLAEASRDELVGNEMILDYCHPSPEGHRRIALLALTAILQTYWPDQPIPSLAAADLLPPEGEGAGVASSAFGAAWAGQMLLRQGQLGQAEPLFRRALDLDPDLATAHEGLGRILASSGRTAEAVIQLEAATRLAPGMSNVWNNLGQAYRVAGRYQDALTAYERAAKTGPGSGVIHRNMAATLLQLDRPSEALAQALTATQASPGDAPGWVQLGRTHVALGQFEEAAQAYGQALLLDPGEKSARQGLVALSERQP